MLVLVNALVKLACRGKKGSPHDQRMLKQRFRFINNGATGWQLIGDMTNQRPIHITGAMLGGDSTIEDYRQSDHPAPLRRGAHRCRTILIGLNEKTAGLQYGVSMTREEPLPTRDTNHSRSSWSTRAFENALPREWVIHPLAEDYGIDRRVEIFEDSHTTGIFFNVQLKSTDRGSGHQPAESIRRTTLNYWNQTPDATLVVIAHDSTQTLWYRWAHLLPHDQKPHTKQRQVRCEQVLSPSSSGDLAEEARAWRLARELSRHLPVDVHLTGGTFYGQSAAPLKRAIAKKLASLPSYFRVTHSTPALPYLQVSIEDSRVMAGLIGSYSRQITWDLRGERDHGEIASDVIASLALSCSHVGAEDLCVQLLKLVANDTRTLMDANGFGYAMALLTKRQENETVLTLLRRTTTAEESHAKDIAIAAISSATPTPELVRAVAHVVRDAARGWKNPAMGLYNAANTLRAIDPGESIALYEEAAEADPAYRSRGYWWREKGSTHWRLQQADEAEASYRRAIELGETQAQAYLADLLMRTGRYREARDTFGDAPIWKEPADAQWRLSYNTLKLIVDELGIEEQARQTLGVSGSFPKPDDDSKEALEAAALDAIATDALNGWAYTGLATAWNGNDEKNPLIASLAAAVIVNTAGFLWMNLLIDTVQDKKEDERTRMLIAQDAMWCARKYFGDSFANEILEYPFLEEEARAHILEFFEAVRLPDPTVEWRRHSDGGEYESDFIPTSPRPRR